MASEHCHTALRREGTQRVTRPPHPCTLSNFWQVTLLFKQVQRYLRPGICSQRKNSTSLLFWGRIPAVLGTMIRAPQEMPENLCVTPLCR